MKIRTIFLAFAVSLGAAQALGYILPAKQILGLVVEQIRRSKTLVVFQKTVLYDPQIEGGMQELEETLYYKDSSRFRGEISVPGLQKILVVAPEGVVNIVDGKIMGDSEGPFDHYKDVLLSRDPDALADRLERLGVDLRTVSLGRFEDKVAFVIGAKYPDESVAQLWVEKESFSPLRLVLGGDDPSPFREIEYLDYRPLGKGAKYPGRILFYENGNLVRMHVLDSFEMNPELSDALFDIAAMKDKYLPVSPVETPDQPSDLDEVKKSIQDFRKVFE